MTIRWYLDEDTMARALVRGLRARGIDVMTPLEADLMGRPDEDQLLYATAQQRVLYTFNVGDFCRLHREYLASGRSHSGIVVVSRQRYSIGELIRGLATLTGSRFLEDMVDSLVFLEVG